MSNRMPNILETQKNFCRKLNAEKHSFASAAGVQSLFELKQKLNFCRLSCSHKFIFKALWNHKYPRRRLRKWKLCDKIKWKSLSHKFLLLSIYSPNSHFPLDARNKEWKSMKWNTFFAASSFMRKRKLSLVFLAPYVLNGFSIFQKLFFFEKIWSLSKIKLMENE